MEEGGGTPREEGEEEMRRGRGGGRMEEEEEEEEVSKNINFRNETQFEYQRQEAHPPPYPSGGGSVA
jgi:hypothetical protein